MKEDGDDLGWLIKEAGSPENQVSLPFTAHAVMLEEWEGGHTAFYNGDRTCPWVWVNEGNVKFGSAEDLNLPDSTIGVGTITRLVTEKRNRREPDMLEPIEPIPNPIKPSDTLSTPEQRTQELLSLIPVREAWIPRFIMEVLPRIILETVKAKRRMEDRIVQRVIEAMKK